MVFCAQELVVVVFISIVRRLENRRPGVANQPDSTQMSSHDQELSNDLCVSLYCCGTHSGKLPQSLNCQNGPYKAHVPEAGTLSRGHSVRSYIWVFEIHASELVFPAAPSRFDGESNENGRSRKNTFTRTAEQSCAELRSTVRLKEAVVRSPLRP